MIVETSLRPIVILLWFRFRLHSGIPLVSRNRNQGRGLDRPCLWCWEVPVSGVGAFSSVWMEMERLVGCFYHQDVGIVLPTKTVCVCWILLQKAVVHQENGALIGKHRGFSEQSIKENHQETGTWSSNWDALPKNDPKICGSQILILWLCLHFSVIPLTFPLGSFMIFGSQPRQEFPEFEGDFMSPDIDEKAGFMRWSFGKHWHFQSPQFFRKFYHFYQFFSSWGTSIASWVYWYQLTAQAIRAERPEDMCLAIARAKAGHWNQRVSPGFGIIFSSKPYHGYNFLARRQKETRLSMEKFDCWWFRGVSRGTFTSQQPLQVVPMPQPQIQGKLQQADALVPKVAKDALLVCMDQADWWWLGCFCISFFSFKPWKRWRCAMVVSEKSRKVRKRQGCRNFYWSFLKGRGLFSI